MARRSTSTSTDTPEDDIVVGMVRAAHGLKGEVRVEPYTDFVSERFRAGAKLKCEDLGTLTVRAVRGTDAQPILSFEEIADRAGADRLRMKHLSVPRGDARRSAGEGHLWDDLIGMTVVTPDGEALGSVSEVLRAGAADVLVVRGGTRELLLPAIEPVVRVIDREARRIVAVPQEEI